MLAGLRSRWTIPFACADSSASAIWIPRSSSVASSIGPAPDPLRERLSLEQLHGDEVLALVLVDRVDGADPGVVERRGRARLALEALEGGRVGGELGGQELERDVPAELRVLGLVDDAHAAAAELRDDPVVGDGLADHRPSPSGGRRPALHGLGRVEPLELGVAVQEREVGVAAHPVGVDEAGLPRLAQRRDRVVLALDLAEDAGRVVEHGGLVRAAA